MPDYRRYFVPGGTYFFTLVSFERRPRFAGAAAIQQLRDAVAAVQHESPFHFAAAVVLPDHMHFLWTLPAGDTDYSRRIGKIKVHFTRSCAESNDHLVVSESRYKHRERDVWQRRFWEHTVTDEQQMEALINYIHYNPVKHGLVSCPHAWAASSFNRWVALGQYEATWGCSCKGRCSPIPKLRSVEELVGEP
jgi:putative transposase